MLDHPRGRGKSSGLDIGMKGATLFHIRDGRAIKLVINWDREQAFADLGLTPDTEPSSAAYSESPAARDASP